MIMILMKAIMRMMVMTLRRRRRTMMTRRMTFVLTVGSMVRMQDRKC